MIKFKITLTYEPRYVIVVLWIKLMNLISLCHKLVLNIIKLINESCTNNISAQKKKSLFMTTKNCSYTRMEKARFCQHKIVRSIIYISRLIIFVNVNLTTGRAAGYQFWCLIWTCWKCLIEFVAGKRTFQNNFPPLPLMYYIDKIENYLYVVIGSSCHTTPHPASKIFSMRLLWVHEY